MFDEVEVDKRHRRIVKASSKWSQNKSPPHMVTPMASDEPVAMESDERWSIRAASMESQQFAFVTPAAGSKRRNKGRYLRKSCETTRSSGPLTTSTRRYRRNEEEEEEPYVSRGREANLLSVNHGLESFRYEPCDYDGLLAWPLWARAVLQRAQEELRDVAGRLQRIQERPLAEDSRLLEKARRLSCAKAADILENALKNDDDDRNCGALDILASLLLKNFLPCVLSRTTEVLIVETYDNDMLDTTNIYNTYDQFQFCFQSTVTGHLSCEEHRYLSKLAEERQHVFVEEEGSQKESTVLRLLYCVASCVLRRYKNAFLCPSSAIACLRLLAAKRIEEQEDEIEGKNNFACVVSAAVADACGVAFLGQFHRGAAVTDAKSVPLLASVAGPLLCDTWSRHNKGLLLPRAIFDFCAAIVTSLRSTASHFRGELSAPANLAFVRLCQVVADLTTKQPLLGLFFDALEVAKTIKQVDNAAKHGKKTTCQTLPVGPLFEDPSLYQNINDLRRACQDTSLHLSTAGHRNLEKTLLEAAHIANRLRASWEQRNNLDDLERYSWCRDGNFRALNAALTVACAKQQVQREARVPQKTDPSSKWRPEEKKKTEDLTFVPLSPVSDASLDNVLAAFEITKACFEAVYARHCLLLSLQDVGQRASFIFETLSALGRPQEGVIKYAISLRSKEVPLSSPRSKRQRENDEFAGGGGGGLKSADDEKKITNSNTLEGKKKSPSSLEDPPPLLSKKKKADPFVAAAVDLMSRRVAETRLAKLRRWMPENRDLDDLEKHSYLLDANRDRLALELKDAERLQVRVTEVNNVAPAIARQVLRCQILASCLERQAPRGLVKAALQAAKDANESCLDDDDDTCIASLFLDLEELQKQNIIAEDIKKDEKKEDPALVVGAFFAKARADLTERCDALRKICQKLKHLEWRAICVVYSGGQLLSDDRLDDMEKLLRNLSGDITTAVLDHDFLRFSSYSERKTTKIFKKRNVLSDASYDFFRRHVFPWVTAAYDKAKGDILRMSAAIRRETKRAGLAAGDRVRVAKSRDGLVMSVIPETGETLNKNNNNRASSGESHQKPLWHVDEWDDDPLAQRDACFAVAIDDLPGSNSRSAPWGTYNWNTGYWWVARENLEVVVDAIVRLPPPEEKVGAAAAEAYRRALDLAKTNADNAEFRQLLQTIDTARGQLKGFSSETKDATWANAKLADLSISQLKRLARNAQAAAKRKRNEVQDLKVEVADLRYAVGSSHSKSLPVGDWRDAAFLAHLKSEKVCLQRDLEAKRRLFDDYVNDLVDHFKKTGSPSSEWTEKKSPSPLAAKDLDVAAFERMNDDDSNSIDSSFRRRRREKTKRDNNDEEDFVFPFGVLPSGKKDNAEDAAEKKISTPVRYDDEFFNAIRKHYLWWTLTWVDVTNCETCYGACPKADLLGSLSAKLKKPVSLKSLKEASEEEEEEDEGYYAKTTTTTTTNKSEQVPSSQEAVCPHVAASCASCLTEYARSALGDASMVSKRGLPCFDSRSRGCEACYAPKLLEDLNILRGPDIKKLERFIRAARLRGGDRGWCPNADCDTVVDFDCHKPACPTCALALCKSCRQAAHDGDCAQHLGVANLKLAEDKRFQACPRCKALVEKAEACDHMSCTCGARFCYVCGASGHDCPVTCTKPRHFNGLASSLAVDDKKNTAENTPEEPPKPRIILRGRSSDHDDDLDDDLDDDHDDDLDDDSDDDDDDDSDDDDYDEDRYYDEERSFESLGDY